MIDLRHRCAGWLLIAALCGPPACIAQANKKAEAMTENDFDRMIRNKDSAAVEVSRQSGPPVVPYIEPHLKSPDPAVRLIAVDCLAAAGGPQAAELLIQTLSDSNEQIRANAANALLTNPPTGRQAELLRTWDNSRTRDGYVRQQIPMILGRMQARDEVQGLRGRLNADARQDVKDGIIAGLAKMGDSEARRTLGDMLRDARGERTAQLIEYVKYEDEPWVIPLLVPPLQRRDIAVDLSTHRREIQRRECDIAADEVLRISKVRFSFEENPAGQYSDAEINEVLRYAEALPR